MDAVLLANKIEDRYRQYLKTTFYFRDSVLRTSFGEVLDSGHLSKGPYLEATPVFKRTLTPRILFQSLLGSHPDEGFLKAVDGDRPLYQHQQEAIQQVFTGQNSVIATGTGSGKTEAFIYPILLNLFQEYQAGTLCPGVRALVLYPMNALANDQRDRLGQIAGRLGETDSQFQFTFGQYIGETPEDAADSKRYASDHRARRLSGEMVFRSEMRETPPHILLTNYSMLEYLLLRPDDSPLFDNGAARWWKHIVLDEAHQYRGSRGTEMAMLIRRLKRRLREGGRSGIFRCIATSATLVGEEGDRAKVAEFASDLFNEKFREENVILGKTEQIPEAGPKSLTSDDYRLLRMVLQGKAADPKSLLAELMTRLDVPVPDNESLPKIIGSILQCDGRATRLRRLITAEPAEVDKIADEIFSDLPGQKRVSALSELVELLLQAKDPASETHLLSARYHLLLRSLEGAFVSYWPEKRVFLDRKSPESEDTAFEGALCRECGQLYFVGRIEKGKLVEAIRDPSNSNFGATFLRPLENGWNNDEEDEGSEVGDGEVFQLCARCGEIGQGNPICGHENSIHVVKEKSPSAQGVKDEDRADQMATCGACGYNAAGRDPVREVVHGTDGPHAVIATTLYQSLPETRKKVLAFADGRQEAAFFAWYLEDSYKGILSRNSVYKIARSFSPYPAEGIALSTIADKAFHSYRDAFTERASDDEPTIRRNIWRALYKELLTDEQRISLEGVGLIRWSVRQPDSFKIPEILRNEPWSIAESEAWDLLYILLDFMRADRAVELRTGTNVSLNWSDLGLQGWQMRVLLNEKGELRKGERRWNGKTGKRVCFLAKLLKRIKPDLSPQAAVEEATSALRAIWETLRQVDENVPDSHDRLLLSVNGGRRLNPDWYRLGLIADNGTIFQCDTCGRLQSGSVRAICPRHRCHGALQEVRCKELVPNHYRILYEENLPGPLRVEEHTAQLDHEKAREFQRDFESDRIHVLSCSTTFELGVDLGNLDTIFLRNVPPEAFNYAQRVGRAGRRSGFPGFAITYCRRGPHDLYHFSEPLRMLRGKVRPPVLSLRNEKIITRHVAATAISAFFRAFRERFKAVQGLFKDLANPSGLIDLRAYLYEHRAELEESLRAIIPSEIVTAFGLVDGSWIERITAEESRFSLAEAEVKSDYRTIKDYGAAAAVKEEYDDAKWAKGRANEIANEEVLSFLSRKAVIPKYGFPVDVVELDTQKTQHSQESMEVSLQRDLTIALSEFAPTSKLVANKKVWTSYGLKKVAEKSWPRKLYKRCAKHNVFLQWKDGCPEPITACGDHLPISKYIIPRFGFVTNRDKPKDPTNRTTRVFTTRPYFAGSLGPDTGIISIPSQSPLITMKKASPGLMTVLCEGRRGEGFYICGGCGAGFRKREKTHKTPYGQDCHGTLERLSLGHEFETDVLQLQFHPESEKKMEPAWFAYSLAYAIVEGASEVLVVPLTDLNATVAHSEGHSVPPIILYDNVPGGAGLVAGLEDEKVFRASLEAARSRVGGKCGCDESTSCYGCLRNYKNQFAHQNLSRGPVMRYLDSMLSNWG